MRVKHTRNWAVLSKPIDRALTEVAKNKFWKKFCSGCSMTFLEITHFSKQIFYVWLRSFVIIGQSSDFFKQQFVSLWKKFCNIWTTFCLNLGRIWEIFANLGGLRQMFCANLHFFNPFWTNSHFPNFGGNIA